MTVSPLFVGRDISKARIDVFDLVTGARSLARSIEARGGKIAAFDKAIEAAIRESGAIRRRL